MTVVVAIDPGAKQKSTTLDVRGTGWARVVVHDDRPPELKDTYLAPGGTRALVDHITGLWTPFRELWQTADVIVVENFILLEARANIEPLEMVGVVRGIGAAQGKSVVVQNPDERTIVSHDDLKRIGMWPGGKGHADEAQAVRHALAWALRSGNRPTVELLAPDPGEDDEAPVRPGPSAW